MTMKTTTTILHSAALASLLLAPLAGCAGDEALGTPTGDGTRGVTFGGAADIGQFRSVVDRGEVPDVTMLDEVGFFAEHAIDLPAADCGADVCVQSGLAVAPRFDGGNWTMGYVALRTDVDPATLPRGPTHVVLALDRRVRFLDQLPSLFAELEGVDRVSVVAFDRDVEVMVTGAEPMAVPELDLPRGVADRNLFGGLAEAIALARADATRKGRVVLFTEGPATAGIEDPALLRELAAEAAREGIPTTVITTADTSAYPRALAQAGGGSFYFAESRGDMDDILTILGQTTLHPLATDLRLEVRPMDGYTMGRIFGAPAGTVVDASGARIEAPALFVGSRASESDVRTGRRGGGGGFFVELLAEADSGIGAGHQALSVAATYQDAAGATQTVESGSWNVLEPGQNPDGMWPAFSNREISKPFMMLNMYLGIHIQTDLYGVGDCARARGVLQMMERSVEGWQGVYDDPDIAADFALMQRLDANIQGACADSDVVEPTTYIELSCMMI